MNVSLNFVYLILSEKIADAIKADVQIDEPIDGVQLAFSRIFNIPKTGSFSLHDLTVGYFKALVDEVKKKQYFVPDVLTR